MTKILILEDNTDITSMLQTLLKHSGYAVTCLANGNELESTLRKEKTDLLLLDLLLSEGYGTDYCRSIKTNPEFRHIPVIMMSAFPDVREKCMEAMADDFIEKPFDIHDLVAKIEQWKR